MSGAFLLCPYCSAPVVPVVRIEEDPDAPRAEGLITTLKCPTCESLTTFKEPRPKKAKSLASRLAKAFSLVPPPEPEMPDA